MGNNLTFGFWTSGALITRTAIRQFRFPRIMPGIFEALTLASVFIVAGIFSLGVPIKSMLGPMVPVVLMMMSCMVASGVYREEINHSIGNLYLHSFYGFVLAAFCFRVVVMFLPADYSSMKFYFFFLFFGFFVSNTIRPLLIGTDFMDGGGRRGN